jgi:hypothetical protein
MADTAATATAMDTGVEPIGVPADYINVSLNKMFLYTGELQPFIEKYIIDLNQKILLEDKKQFLKHIYAERSNSGIDIKHDFETVNNVNIVGLAVDDLIRAIGSDQKLKNALYCLAYADYIHTTSGAINTLFLNPFFFPFHRAFILPDGIHDLVPRLNMTAKFWKLLNTKDYRNKEDLRAAIFNTAIKPDGEWSDDTGKKYIDKWSELSADGGHGLLEPTTASERTVANVIIPPVQESENLSTFIAENMTDNKIYKVGDSSKLIKYTETAEEKKERKKRESERKKLKKKNTDGDEEDEDDSEGGGGAFNTDFSNEIIKKYGFNSEKSFAVSDCAGPNAGQYELILADKTKARVSSIVSGSLDSSSGANIGLRKHLKTILKNIGYSDDRSICILLPEASILNADKTTIKEVMQKIIIGPVNNDDETREFAMSFELWAAPTQFHCPTPQDTSLTSNNVTIDDFDKCPGVNETIQYIFSKFGVKNSSFLKSAACCLFGMTGGGKKLNADAETNDFLDKYYEAFEALQLNLTMDEIGGCLFRVKTMGDFYRLSDTALIQYLINGVQGQAMLGTCDEYNAINSYASNNLWTIYGTPHHRFQCYGPPANKLSPAEQQVLDEAKQLEKQKNELIKKINVIKDLDSKMPSFIEKLTRRDSKIKKSIALLDTFFQSINLETILTAIISETDTINELIKTKIIDDMSMEEPAKRRPQYVKIWQDNKIAFTALIDNLKTNASNKIYTLLALYLLQLSLNQLAPIVSSYEVDKQTAFITEMEEAILALGSADDAAVIKEKCNAYINKYSIGVSLLYQLNSNELDTIKDTFFNKNDPNDFINYDSYYNVTKPQALQNNIVSNNIAFKKTQPKEYKKLCDKLFAISNTNNYSSLTETMYNNYLHFTSGDSTANTQLITSQLSNFSKLYMPVITKHDETVKGDINAFIARVTGVAAPMEAGNNMTGGQINLSPDIIKQINIYIQDSITNIERIIYNGVPLTKKVNNIIVSIQFFNSSITKNKDSLDYLELYKNKTELSRHYYNLVELIEYVIDNSDDKRTPLIEDRKMLITNLNELNKHFKEIIQTCINNAYGEIPEFITINAHLTGKKQEAAEILKTHLHDLYMDFIENGIFIRNYVYTYQDIVNEQGEKEVSETISSGEQTYFYLVDNAVNRVIIKDNSIDIILENINERKIIFGSKLFDITDITQQIVEDYPEFRFTEAADPAKTIFLAAIFLNKYNVDEYLNSKTMYSTKNTVGSVAVARPSIGYSPYYAASAAIGLPPSKLTGYARQEHKFPGLLRRESSGSELSELENPYASSRRTKRKKTLLSARARAGLAGISEERKSASASGHKHRSSGHTHRSSGHKHRLLGHSNKKGKHPRGGGKLKQTRKYVTKHDKYTRKLNKDKNKNQHKTKHNKRRIRKYTIKH